MPHLRPKNPKWKDTSPSGPASCQSMPSKENLHGVGDHYRRIESTRAPIGVGLDSTDHRDSSNLGPLGSNLLTKGANANDTSSGLLPNPTSQAQPHRKHMSSIKSKKALARSLSQPS